ncbi:hypothetical protein FFK22_026500 [Mycobacterium sp. KBS0706]|uniref:hypothetical protein n=1 Tax=Mycobacterium sp. KBS0706 TaxID=2578109 RepID=UPI00110F8F36|nr:hypothetical protein [Mycobacterium sp. KBS0706]TSD85601.1 hypothetical protein FFK22_026500 [Mycobacterium sp. KBS0706]
MSETPRQAEAIHAWLRIYLLNWQEGHRPSALEVGWIALAMSIARDGGSLDRVQDCVLAAITRRTPPDPPEPYGLEQFRRDFAAFRDAHFSGPAAARI